MKRYCEAEVVEHATEDDLRQAVCNALARCGLTYDELAAQAAADDYSSFRARLAWVAIGGLGHLADPASGPAE